MRCCLNLGKNRIRTCGVWLEHNCLASKRLQPLSHFSLVGKRWDSNPRDIVPQTSAKPLSYSHRIDIKKKKTRLFSTSQPKVTFVHWTPINVLVWNVFEIDFGTSFSLEMLSVILSANVAAELYSLRNNSLTRDSAQAILSYTLG